jgi:hypothetical protein
MDRQQVLDAIYAAFPEQPVPSEEFRLEAPLAKELIPSLPYR